MPTVIYLENAFTPHLRRVEQGRGSIQELAPQWDIPFVAFVDGQPVLRAEWELVLDDDQAVAFIEVGALIQGGGGGGGSDPLRMVLMIAVMVYAPYLAAQFSYAIGGGMIMGSVTGLAMTSAAFTLAGVALVNAILPPPKPTSPQQAAALAAGSPTYSLQAQGNAGRLDAAIPEHFGRMIAFPDFAAQPYSEFSGNEQYLYQLLCIGRGEYEVDMSLVKIEDTPIANFDEIECELISPHSRVTLFPTNVVSSIEVSGQETNCDVAVYAQAGVAQVTITLVEHGLVTNDDIFLEATSGGLPSGTYKVTGTALGNSPSVTYDKFTVNAPPATTSGSVNVANWVGPFVANASETTANYIGVDVIAPKGLYYANDDGSLSTLTVFLKVEFRAINNTGSAIGDWVNASDTITYGPWGDWKSIQGIGPGPSGNTTTTEYGENESSTDMFVFHLTRTRVARTGFVMSGTTTTPQRVSERYPVTAGRYEVRVRRTDVETKATRAGHAAIWGGLRSYLVELKTGTYSRVGASVTITIAGHGFAAGVEKSIDFTSGTAQDGGYVIQTVTTDTFTITTTTSGATSGTVNVRPSYGDVTMLAVRMRATNNLSGQASRKINVVCTRKLPVWNGSSWSTNTATRSPAWALTYAAKQIGLTDSQLDLTGLLALDTLTSTYVPVTHPYQDYFDARFDNFLSFWEAATKILGSVRAKPFMQGGVLRVIRDQAVSIPVAMFSPRNMVRGSFSINYLMPTDDTADAVDVKYFDSTRWAPYTVRAKLPGSTATTPAKVDLFGVVDRGQAYREGLYQAAANRYRRKIIKFQTEMEGFIPSFGDLINISHDMPSWGQSGEVTEWVSGTKTLTLSEPVTFTTGTHYIGLRKRDGSVDGPYVVTAGVDAYHIVLVVTPTYTPYTGMGEERTHFTFGAAETWRQPARVLSVKPLSNTTVEIECVNEDSNVHTADTGVITPSIVTSGLANYTSAPVVGQIAAKMVPFGSGKMIVTWAAASWANQYIVQESAEGANWTTCGITSTTSITCVANHGMLTHVRVAAVGFSRGPWSETVVTPTPIPTDVTGLSATVMADGVLLQWASSSDPYFSDYEVRQGNTDWSSSEVLMVSRSTQLKLPPMPTGLKTWRVKKIDDTHQESANNATVSVILNNPSAPVANYELATVTEILSWTIPSSNFTIDYYEIRYGASWLAGLSTSTTTKSTSYRKTVDYNGDRTYWIAAVDTAANVGVPTRKDVAIVVPGPVTGARTEVVDNNVLIFWEPPATGSLPIDHYEVRKGASWAVGVPIGSNGNSTFTTVFEQVKDTYTYWISSRDSAYAITGVFGNPVGTSAFVSQPPDYTLRSNIDSVFSGTKTNAVVVNGNLVLPVNPTETWSQHFANNGYATPQAQISAGYPLYLEPTNTAASYSETTDYGTTLSSTNITAILSSVVIAGSVTIACQIQYSNTSSTGPWTNATAGATSCLASNFRWVKVTYSFSATGSTNLLSVSGLNIKLSVKQRSDSGVGTVTNAATGVVVPFEYDFVSADTPIVQPGGTTPLIPVVDYAGGAYPTSFTVYLYNTAGAKVTGNFSWSVKGY